jgi:hypothetical protein
MAAVSYRAGSAQGHRDHYAPGIYRRFILRTFDQAWNHGRHRYTTSHYGGEPLG